MQQHDRDEVVRAAQQTWAASPAIRAEFTSLESFVAYRSAIARGDAKILGRNTTALQQRADEAGAKWAAAVHSGNAAAIASTRAEYLAARQALDEAL
jgi:hypothetical protein